MEIRAVKEAELEQAVELQRLVFRPREGASALERYRTYVREDPSYRLGQTRVVVEGGRLVGHLRVWDRQIRVRGALLRAGGIGSVLTHPDFRGRGYARALMRDTERYLREAGYDLGLLFTIIGTPFYSALGWTPIPLPTFSLRLATEADVGQVGAGVRRLAPERDLAEVAAIHAACTEGMTGPEVRPGAYWRSGPSRVRGLFPAWGALQDGRLAGYVTFEVEPERVWVKEACALPGCEPCYRDLAGVVCAEATGAGVRTVAGSLPRGHGLAEGLAETAGAQLEWGTHDEMMVKLANWDTLRAKLRGAGAPENRPGPEGPFWQALFGQGEAPQALRAWMDSLPPCGAPFYWWSDIF